MCKVCCAVLLMPRTAGLPVILLCCLLRIKLNVSKVIAVINCNIIELDLLYNEVLATRIAFNKYKNISSESRNINM